VCAILCAYTSMAPLNAYRSMCLLETQCLKFHVIRGDKDYFAQRVQDLKVSIVVVCIVTV
jgi:hypothetical protein